MKKTPDDSIKTDRLNRDLKGYEKEECESPSVMLKSAAEELSGKSETQSKGTMPYK